MNQALNKILCLPLPPNQGENIRRLSRKDQAAKIRFVLRGYSFTGISVTAPNYSMAQAVHIRIPAQTHTDNAAHNALHDEIFRNGGHTTDCPDCAQHWEAQEYIERVILAAFPDLADRSDLQSDYFDYCLSIS